MGSTFSSLEHPLKANDLLFFMHTPKTAGATLLPIVERQFDEDKIARWLYPFQLLDMPPEFFTQYLYFHGHVEYSLMRSFLPKPPVTITMLRDPVERYLSHVGNYQRAPLSQIPDTTPDIFNQFKRTSLADFVYDPPEVLVPLSRYVQNLQAKFLASEIDSEQRPLGEQKELIKTLQYNLPVPDLEQAKRRLDQFAFVGLTERFQDSLFLMAYTFGWLPITEYKSINRQQPRPQQDKLPPDLLEKINDMNSLSQQVYAYGRDIFQKRYQQMEQELLERYGRREDARLKLPLAADRIVELLEDHYRQRFIERNPTIPAIKLFFNKKIAGRNWHGQEYNETFGGTRWSGPGRCARLDLPLAILSNVWLRVSVIAAITQEILDSLVVKVNDEPIAMRMNFSQNGARIYVGYVSQNILARQPGCTTICFEVAKTLKPADIMPENEDDRRLGIAINWVQVEPAPPLTLIQVEHRDFAQQYQTFETNSNIIHPSPFGKLAQRFKQIFKR